jgi:hypothetical protein
MTCVKNTAKYIAIITFMTNPFGVTRTQAAEPIRTQELKPSPMASPREERANYQKCRKAALGHSQKLKQPQKVAFLRAALSQCREQYPAVSVLRRCKKEAFQAYRDHEAYLKSALEECRFHYKQYTFNPDSALPFKTSDKSVFFTGAGLNHPVAVGRLPTADGHKLKRRFGNFNCEPMIKALVGRTKPEYILFGNAMTVYRPFQDIEPGRLLKALQRKGRIEGPQLIHPQWGQILPAPDGDYLRHFFPTSFCQFDRKLGSLYEDIKIYYLLDTKRKRAIPYFGISFYSDEANVAVSDLIDLARNELGDDYRVHSRKDGVHMLSAAPIKETDDEGDPFNLCRYPRHHDKIILIAQRPNEPHAAYFLLSNLRNLCRHGDQLASRFRKTGL